ncbi:MAG TPA: DUF3800 domain-containing protein [Pseudolabrys sp.]|nr:DUF3800 domain-containing protein [Pseudolabrys sp.]
MRSFVHASERYRLFFDETGNGDLHAAKKDPHQRYLSVTSLVIRQDIHDDAITQQLTALKADIFGKSNASVILHRREILNRQGAFEALSDDKLRAAFDAKFIDVIKAIPAPVFTISIDKEAHLEKYKVWQFNPYHYVMTCLLERFVLWLNSTGNTGDVMGEARNPTHDAQLRRSFRRFCDEGTTVRTTVIRRTLISKELRLKPKTANIAALQIADLLAHPAHRNYKRSRLQEPIPQDYGTSLVRIVEESKYNRKPGTSQIEGYGRKWLP